MSVKIEVIEGGTPHNTILAAGLVAAIVGIYLTYVNVIMNTTAFAVFGGLGAVAALVWGSHAVKRLASYGIGTGVPSMGMIAFGSGVIGMLLATKFGLAAPIAAIIIGAILGAIFGGISYYILKMHIPVMIQSMTELAIVGALTLMGFCAMVTGRFTFDILAKGTTAGIFGAVPDYSMSLIGGSIITVTFILGAIAIQHPFNACLGPSWKQDRMLWLAVECGFLSMIGLAVISFAFLGFAGVVLNLVVAGVGWFYAFAQYIMLSKRDAAAWLDMKPIVEPEGGH